MGDAFMSRSGSIKLVQKVGNSIINAMSQKASTENFALKSHFHDVCEMNTGVLPISQGGTGSTNFYERGYWTPIIGSSGSVAPTVSYDYRYGVYYRVGDLVYISCHIKMSISSAGDNYACIQGLPYVCATGCDKYGLSLVEEFNATSSGDGDPRGFVIQGINQIYLRGHSGVMATTWNTGSGQYIGYSGCYIKD